MQQRAALRVVVTLLMLIGFIATVLGTAFAQFKPRPIDPDSTLAFVLAHTAEDSSIGTSHSGSSASSLSSFSGSSSTALGCYFDAKDTLTVDFIEGQELLSVSTASQTNTTAALQTGLYKTVDDDWRPSLRSDAHRGWDDACAHFCVTLWGEYLDCYSQRGPRRSPEHAWGHCKGRVNRFTRAARCAVASSALSAATLVMSVWRWLQIFQGWYFREVCLLLCVTTFGVGCATWALMGDVYARRMGADRVPQPGRPCTRMAYYRGPNAYYAAGMELAEGFWLLVVGWVAHGVVFLLLLVL